MHNGFMLFNFLNAKLCPFVFGATFTAWTCNLLAYVAAFLVASFWGLKSSVASWLVRETQIYQVADSNPTCSRFG